MERTGLPLTISVFNNSVSLPARGNMLLFGAPLHPGVRLGTELYWKTRLKHQWFQTLDISAYWIQELHYGLGLSSDFGYRHLTPYNMFYQVSFGLGYLHTFNDGPIFVLNSEGEYEKKTDWGRPHLAPQFGAGIGYDFKLRNEQKLGVFLQYQFQLEYPFTIPGEIPLLPHSCIFLGTRFHFPKKTR
jgi:hypothetical protein